VFCSKSAVTLNIVFQFCASISRKVASSIPSGVEIFHRVNPSGHTVVLGLTQPLTEVTTRNIYWAIKTAGAYV
jgi:hypothetical protein